MDSAQRAHIEHLLQLNRAHLRELEAQQAKLGIMAPSGIAVQIDEYLHAIGDLERQLAEALPRHNLPPRDYERFVGRQKELEEVRRLLLPYPKSRHHLVTIDGIGGIGKSALALETAYHARESYASLPEPERLEAIVWVSAKRTYLTADGILEQRQAFRTLDDLYAAIAQVLDYPAITRAPAEDQRAIVERVLAEQRTLLILDNLETVDDEELLIFLRLLPDPTKAIVTTRHRIDVAYPVRLLGMPQADALALIGQEAARKGVALAPDEQEQLFARTGGVPLAIVWSIGLMGLGGSIESVLRRLGSGQSDIARFCFDESVAQIRGRDAHKLLLALSLFASDASREALGIVAGLGEDEFGRDIGLEELLRLSLVNKDGDRFSLLPLTKSFVLNELKHLPDLEHALREQWIEYLQTLARPYMGLHWQWRDLHPLRREGVHLVTLATWCQEATRLDILTQIYPAMVSYYNVIGQWADILSLGNIVLEFSRLKGNLESIVYTEAHALARILSRQGKNQEAESAIIDALNTAEQMANAEWKCEVLVRYSQVLRRSNQFDEALEMCQRARHFTADPQQSYIQAHIEHELGKIARDRGDWHSAYAHFIEAQRLFGWNENDPSLNIEHSWDLLSNLAFVMHQLGDLDASRRMYLHYLDFARRQGRRGNIVTLLGLAMLEEQQNNPEAALGYARNALEWSDRLGMQREQAEAEALLARLGD